MALLLMHLKDPRAQEFVKLLEAVAHAAGPFVSWKSERQEMLDFSSDNSFETTAYALKALANLDPKSDLLPRAARWLMEHRSDGYYWDSTEQTATAIYGLIDYLKISGELKPNYTLDGFPERPEARRTAHHREGRRQSASHRSDGQRAAGARGGERSAHREVRPGSALLVSVGILFSRASPSPRRRAATALNVVREYFKLAPERQDNRIVYSEQPLAGSGAKRRRGGGAPDRQRHARRAVSAN